MSTKHRALPLVGVTSCTFTEGGATYYKAGEKYIKAVLESADALPVILPSLGADLSADALLDRVDGLLFTGSLSNVYPDLYGDRPSLRAEPFDRRRDATTFPLLKAAIERGVPALCICRGFQELNVALGGTLVPCIHDMEGRMDHRRPEGGPDVQYGPKHRIRIRPDGILAKMLADMADMADTVPPGMPKVQIKRAQDQPEVNSLHFQGIKDPAPALQTEATAPDGTIEAVSMPGAKGFLFGVQWHPEYRSTENALSTAIFQAFARALKPA